MLKGLLRIIGLIMLALALITMVLDLTRSIADSDIIITVLGKDMSERFPAQLQALEFGVQQYLHPAVWDYGFRYLLSLPTWLVFAALALFFLWLGRPRQRVWERKYRT